MRSFLLHPPRPSLQCIAPHPTAVQRSANPSFPTPRHVRPPWDILVETELASCWKDVSHPNCSGHILPRLTRRGRCHPHRAASKSSRLSVSCPLLRASDPPPLEIDGLIRDIDRPRPASSPYNVLIYVSIVFEHAAQNERFRVAFRIGADPAHKHDRRARRRLWAYTRALHPRRPLLPGSVATSSSTPPFAPASVPAVPLPPPLPLHPMMPKPQRPSRACAPSRATSVPLLRARRRSMWRRRMFGGISRLWVPLARAREILEGRKEGEREATGTGMGMDSASTSASEGLRRYTIAAQAALERVRTTRHARKARVEEDTSRNTFPFLVHHAVNVSLC
ncbi:hypothetical protein B0H19DRAFT_540522 [Mycena capillaripes]|nr:hypothetical protein B0H19DRAFT_540522 [Mycena capillaripes]